MGSPVGLVLYTKPNATSLLTPFKEPNAAIAESYCIFAEC